MIYLDHAATSFPKPPEVVDAVVRWFREVGVSPARGDSGLCEAAAELEAGARRRLAELCGVRPDRVVFASGATEALNLFLWGLLEDGDGVLTTAQEHSSVARPLRALAAARGVRVEVLPVDREGYVDPDAAADALARGRYRLLALSHASNVTGAVQDAAALCERARAKGCLSLLDASQTAGVLPLAALGADAVAASAHKSLLGPPGLGFLAVREGIDLRPVKQGGTGSSRALDTQPLDWPAGFEAGTPNGPAIAGLGAALEWLAARDPGALLARCLDAVDRLRGDLAAAGRFHFHGPQPGTRPRLAILSFTKDGLDPAEAGAILDAAGIHVRTGFHCAPWIHRYLGTEAAGTVRVSPGPLVSADEALAVARALGS